MTKPPPRTEEYSNRKSHHKPSSTPASYFATLFLVVGFQLLLCFRASIYCNAFPIVSHLRSTSAASAVVPTSFYSPFVSQLRAQHGETDARTSSLQVSDASARLDPLLTSFLLRSVRSSNNDNGDDTNTDNSDTAEENGDYNQNNKGSFTFSDASKAMIGLQVWDMTMRKARLPLASDFQTINYQTNSNVWPEEPLFSRLHDTLSGLALPRLIRRHPEILTSVLLGVAKLVIQYTIESRQGKLVMLEEKDDDNNDDEYNEENDYWDNYLDETMEMEDELSQEFEYQPLSLEELERLAESLATDLTKEWGGVVQGVSLLDKTFGYDHGLLDLQVFTMVYPEFSSKTILCSNMQFIVIHTSLHLMHHTGRHWIWFRRWSMATQWLATNARATKATCLHARITRTSLSSWASPLIRGARNA